MLSPTNETVRKKQNDKMVKAQGQSCILFHAVQWILQLQYILYVYIHQGLI